MFNDFIESLSCDKDMTFTEKVRYSDIDIVARADFYRSVDCDMMNIEGEGLFYDLVTCDDFVCNGKAILKKRLISRNAVVSGNCEVYGKINSDIVTSSGMLIADGKISAILVSIAGKLILNDKLSCDKIKITGAVDIKQKIKTIEFDLKYNGMTSKIVELSAETVIVDSDIPVPTDFALVCDNIVCDECNIAYSNIDYIFCEKAIIGPGCNIRIIECHEEPLIASGSNVEKIIRF